MSTVFSSNVQAQQLLDFLHRCRYHNLKQHTRSLFYIEVSLALRVRLIRKLYPPYTFSKTLREYIIDCNA
jgi:hypothetical protein